MPNRQSFAALAESALKMIEEDFVVGLGSGRTATAFVRALGQRVQQGLRVRAIPTSQATAQLAQELGIPLVTLDEVPAIDVTVDGADEVDPQLNLIKGLGGALVREKIIASASRRLVIVAGAEKIVSGLGERGILPVEVVPFGLSVCRRRLSALGYPAISRERDGKLVITDNGNYILDCRIRVLPSPAAAEQAIRAVPGVVGTGLFLGLADTVLVDTGDEIQVRRRNH
jgi:ribose 5-phosphate isomerase A